MWFEGPGLLFFCEVLQSSGSPSGDRGPEAASPGHLLGTQILGLYTSPADPEMGGAPHSCLTVSR